MQTHGSTCKRSRPTNLHASRPLVEQLDLLPSHFERKTLLDDGKRKDDLALMPKFRDHAVHAIEDSAANSHLCSDLEPRMRPQQIPMEKPLADSLHLFATDGVVSCSPQQMQDPGNRNNREPLLRIETNKHVPGKKRALQRNRAIRPSGPFCINGKVVLHRACIQMLNNALLMVGNNLQYVPGGLLHVSPKKDPVFEITDHSRGKREVNIVQLLTADDKLRAILTREFFDGR